MPDTVDKLTAHGDENGPVPVPDQLTRALQDARRQRLLRSIARAADVSNQNLTDIANGQQTSTYEQLMKIARGMQTVKAERREARLDLSWVGSIGAPPSRWVLPKHFDGVPWAERRAAMEWLRWALNTRARAAGKSDPVSGGNLPGGGDSPAAGS